MKMRKQEQRKVTQDIDRIRTLWGARAGSAVKEGPGTEQEQEHQQEHKPTNAFPCSGNSLRRMSLALTLPRFLGSIDIAASGPLSVLAYDLPPNCLDLTLISSFFGLNNEVSFYSACYVPNPFKYVIFLSSYIKYYHRFCILLRSLNSTFNA